MFLFIRTVTPKHGAVVPAAMQFAADVTGYLNKAFDLKLRQGIRLFGSPEIYWMFEIDSMDKAAALNAKLMKDREYLGMLERGKEFWVEGSLEDKIIAFG